MQFTSTRWSLIDRAAADDPVALEEFCLLYRDAVVGYLVRCKRMCLEQAEEVTQEFFLAKVISQNLFANVSADRGSLRSLIRRSVDNLVRDLARHDSAKKRAPDAPMGAIEDAEQVADLRYQQEYFDVAWARGLLQQTLRRMEAHYQRGDKVYLWDVFVGRLLLPKLSGAKPVSFEELKQHPQLKSPASLDSALSNAKRRFRQEFASVVHDASKSEASEENVAEAWRLLTQPGSIDLTDLLASVTTSSQTEFLDGASPRAIASFLKEDIQGVAFTDHDRLRAMYLEVLRSPATQWTGGFDSSSSAVSDVIFGDSTLEELNALRSVIKRVRADKELGENHRTILNAIYFAVIGSAAVKHQAKISSSSDSTLKAGWSMVLEMPWIDEDLANLCGEAIGWIQRKQVLDEN